MPPNSLTVLVPIKPGEADALRAVLRPIGDGITRRPEAGAGRPYIAFTKSRAIHFARFAILTDPDRGPGAARLLYASIHDGSVEHHAAELAALSTDFEAIWGRLEGYTNREGFVAFLKAHAHQPAAYHIAFRHETVSSIQSAIAARRARHAAGDRPPAPSRSGRRLLAAVAVALGRVARAAPIVVDVVVAIARHGIVDIYRGLLRVLASLDRYPLARLVNRITGNALPPRRSRYSSVVVDTRAAAAPLVPGDEIPSGVHPGFREDVVSQNQLTLVTVIEGGRADRVRAVMAVIDSYARRLSPPGSLIGISTIHFVRWLVIDNGRRLLMVSDYDGSWESYIDEFAEMILSGLDAIWETALAYPPDGARDLPAFKRFLRDHQVPADVFFSAYPGTTVLNIVNALGARDGRRTWSAE